MVGMTVDLAVAVEESLKKLFFPKKPQNAPSRQDWEHFLCPSYTAIS